MKLIPTLALLGPAAVSAAPDRAPSIDQHLAAPRNALEISIAAGYARGGGSLGEGMASLEEVAGAGGVVDVAVAYRIAPSLALGVYGAASTGGVVRRASAGLQAAWHFRPDRTVDPFVTVGAGWSGLWVTPAEGATSSMQGIEVARFQLGDDYRVSESVAIAPMVGGSVDVLDRTSPTDKAVSFTGFAGVAGRFDLGGTR